MGTAHWEEPNKGATNSAGFSALPGGYMWSPYKFSGLGGCACFWSSSKYNPEYAYIIDLRSYGTYVVMTTAHLEGSAYSGRYIKD